MLEHLRDALNASDEPPDPAALPVSMVELAEHLKELRAHLDKLEAERKTVQERYDLVRKQLLPDALATAGVQNMKLMTGGTVYLTVNRQPSVHEAERPAFLEWLRDNGLGSLIKADVHPSTLKAWVRERLENGLPLPPHVKVYEETVAAIRGGR